MIDALLICPTDPDWQAADREALVRLLAGVELIGSPLAGTGDRRWQVGERFLDHVCFLGCSPSLELAPRSDGRPFCHVRLIVASEGPRLIREDRRRPPRCPWCRAAQPEAQLRDDRPAWPCPACGAQLSAAALDWGRGAGIGRCFVVVANVFPSEAVPGDELMRTLAENTGVEWRYFYAPVDE